MQLMSGIANQSTEVAQASTSALTAQLETLRLYVDTNSLVTLCAAGKGSALSSLLSSGPS